MMSDEQYGESVVSIGRGYGRLARPTVTGIATPIEPHDGHTLASPPRLGRELRDVLIVDPDPWALLAAQKAVQSVAEVETCSEFRVARARIAVKPPDLLVTNLRLERFNGLHLVYLTMGTPTRSIVYAEQHDAVLAREVLEAGAPRKRCTGWEFPLSGKPSADR
jgi:PleD family two-component response regulator